MAKRKKSRRDPAHVATDRAIEAYAESVRPIYARADARCAEILAEHLKPRLEEYNAKREAFRNGTLSRQEFRTWVSLELLGEEWQRVLERLTEAQTAANKLAIEGLNEATLPVIAENYNYGTWQVESADD